MAVYACFFPDRDKFMTKTELRYAPRKVLRSQASVTLTSGIQMDTRTVDIASGGVAVATAAPIPVGETCTMTIAITTGGREKAITAVAKVIYSVLSGVEKFKTGFQFLNTDQDSARLIDELIAERANTPLVTSGN
jgi:hypothetical protein